VTFSPPSQAFHKETYQEHCDSFFVMTLLLHSHHLVYCLITESLGNCS